MLDILARQFAHPIYGIQSQVIAGGRHRRPVTNLFERALLKANRMGKRVSNLQSSALVEAARLPGAVSAPIFEALQPMLASLVNKPFSHSDWLFEIKWDGERALAWVQGGAVELRSRNGRVITQQYPELKDLAQRLSAKEAILDGEIVVLDHTGRSDFGRLQSRMNVRVPSLLLQRQAPVVYYFSTSCTATVSICGAFP